MTPADLLTEADRRTEDAVREALEQLANGWRHDEVLVVLEDAAKIVDDLREQADAARELENLLHDRDLWLRRSSIGFGWVKDTPGRVAS